MKYVNVSCFLMFSALLCQLLLVAPGAVVAGESGPDYEKRRLASVGEDGVQRLEVTGGEYYFAPNYIVVQRNKPVELKIRKVAGFIPHNIIVKAPEAGIDFNVSMAKEFQVIRFTPTRVGKYPMSCDKRFLWFQTHREKGMEGIIEVIE